MKIKISQQLLLALLLRDFTVGEGVVFDFRLVEEDKGNIHGHFSLRELLADTAVICVLHVLVVDADDSGESRKHLLQLGFLRSQTKHKNHELLSAKFIIE